MTKAARSVNATRRDVITPLAPTRHATGWDLQVHTFKRSSSRCTGHRTAESERSGPTHESSCEHASSLGLLAARLR